MRSKTGTMTMMTMTNDDHNDFFLAEGLRRRRPRLGRVRSAANRNWRTQSVLTLLPVVVLDRELRAPRLESPHDPAEVLLSRLERHLAALLG